jgi:hypothetical protein
MSFEALCDHRAVVYRATTTRDGFGDTVETFVALPAPPGNNARPNQLWSGTLQNPGPGEIQAMKRQWFLILDFDVKERDLLRVVAGPEAPDVLRIVSVTRPTAGAVLHHLEVNVEPSTVVLP